jgi:hypothetical protein
MQFFPLPSPLPLLPLSGCVHRGGRSSGTAAPAIIRDGPDDRTTKTRYGTASAAASAATEATEEEEYNGYDGVDPRHRLDDGILLRLIVATELGSTATATMLIPAIDVVAVHWAGGLGG